MDKINELKERKRVIAKRHYESHRLDILKKQKEWVIRNRDIVLSKKRAKHAFKQSLKPKIINPLINPTFFDVIDTEAKAYYLGLLFSDGSNDCRSNVKISLQERDGAILQKLTLLIQPTKELTFRNRNKNNPTHQNSYLIYIADRHISEVLKSYGMVKVKSNVIAFPSIGIVPTHLQRHFIRGYFDGDGCISVFKGKYLGVSFSVVGNEVFLLEMQNILINELSLNRTKLGTEKRGTGLTRILCYGGLKNNLKIRDYLYSNSNYYLQRKFDKYASI